MIVILAGISSFFATLAAAWLLHYLSWRDRFFRAGSPHRTVFIQGKVAGDGDGGRTVFSLDAFGKPADSERFILCCGERRLAIDPRDAVVELRYRPGRSADVAVGDRIAVMGLDQDRAGQDKPIEATKMIRAGWPRWLVGIFGVALFFAFAAAAIAARLTEDHGCPAGAKFTLVRQRISQIQTCLRPDETKDGPTEIRAYSGRLIEKGVYRRGQKTGRWTIFHRSGKAKEIAEYRDGRRHGKWQTFDADGVKAGFAEMKRGRGLWRKRHSNDKLAERGLIVDEKKEERWSYFRANGKKAREGEYRGGKKHGAWTRYHKSGAVEVRGTYKLGRRHGTWQWWRKDGSKEKRGAYENGKKHGEWTRWHKNGKVSSRSEFARDVKEGEFSFWSKAGEKMIAGTYRKGSRVGRWTWYCAHCQSCDACDGKASDAVVVKTYGKKAPPPE